jgi:hypothetical protein
MATTTTWHALVSNQEDDAPPDGSRREAQPIGMFGTLFEWRLSQGLRSSTSGVEGHAVYVW